MNKTKIYIGTVLLIGLLFQGCAQKTQLTPEVKKSIDTIKVDNSDVVFQDWIYIGLWE